MEKHKKKGNVFASVCGALWMVAILAALYMIMEYPDNLFGLVGIGLVILGLGIIALSGMGRADKDWGSGNENPNQLQEMLNAQKALYVVSKQNEVLLKQLLKIQQSQVSQILEGNKNIAKVIVKKNMESTDKLIQSNASFMLNNAPIEVEEPAVINEQLTEKMIEKLAQEWEKTLDKSNAKLVSQMEKTMDLSSIQQLGERMPEELAQAMNFAMLPFVEGIDQMPEKLAQLLDKGSLIQELKAAFAANQQNQQQISENTYEEITEENSMQDSAAVTLEEGSESTEELPEEVVIEESTEVIPDASPEETPIEEAKELSIEELAKELEEEPEELLTKEITKESLEEEAAKSIESEPKEEQAEVTEPLESAEEEEEIQIPNISSDSNRMLSPDEIAALVAGVSQSEKESSDETAVATETETKAASNENVVLTQENKDEETTAEEEEIQIPNISSDSNRMLSPDEIAALVAGVSQQEPEIDKEIVESQQSVTESDSDSKKIEDTAGESEQEEEKVEIHVSDDPNRQLSPEEIAALFASI